MQRFEEQRIRLTHSADDEGPILRVGSLLEAEMVVFRMPQSRAGWLTTMRIGMEEVEARYLFIPPLFPSGAYK